MTASVEMHPVVGHDGIPEAATVGRRGANPVIARRMEHYHAGNAATRRLRTTTSIGTS